jgi:hypothetical protein
MLSEIEQFINWVRMRSPQAKTWRDYKRDLELLTRVMEDRDPARLFPRMWTAL